MKGSRRQDGGAGGICRGGRLQLGRAAKSGYLNPVVAREKDASWGANF